MKTAIISDVHGNYPALKAVVDDAKSAGVDSYFFVGDYIFDCPYSNEVVDLIRSLDKTYVIAGNKEGYLADLYSENQSSWNIDQIGAIHQTFRELRKENLEYLLNLPKTCLIPSKIGNIFITHFISQLHAGEKKICFNSSLFAKEMEEKPFSHEEFLKKAEIILNTEENLKIIEKIDASVIIFGHSHLQWHGYCADKLIINPGSCGQPLDFNRDASYTILEDGEFGLKVHEKRVAYDVEKLISHSRKTQAYKKGRIWCELIFLSLQKGKDCFSEFFKIARKIANEKNEYGKYYSNDTWNSAAKEYKEIEENYFL